MQKYTNDINSILAIVVVYKQALFNSETLRSLGSDLENMGIKMDLFIFDNSPEMQMSHSIPGFNLLKHSHSELNEGVSAGYNYGADFAKTLGKRWVILLDQDTCFNEGIIKQYLHGINDFPSIKLFCPIIRLKNSVIFSPFRRVFKRGVAIKSMTAGVYSLRNYSPVNSGMLIDLKSFLEVGGYNFEVRLDFSDLEFTERFSKRNQNFIVLETNVLQDFSNDSNDLDSLYTRFAFFCEGARFCKKNNMFDELQYFIVVFIRATMLAKRTMKLRFYTIMFSKYFA